MEKQLQDLSEENKILRKKVKHYKKLLKTKEKEWMRSSLSMKKKLSSAEQELMREKTQHADSIAALENKLITPSVNVQEKKKICSYKYQETLPLKKEARLKLNGHTCEHCTAYYKADNLSPEELQEKLKHCSRHRGRYSPPPATQASFWRADFPSTQECIEKGYLLTENDEVLDIRRHRK